MTTISLSELTKEQKSELAKQLAAEQESARIQRKENLKALEEIATQQLPTVINKLKHASEVMAEAKLYAFSSLSDYLKLKIDTLGITSAQRSHTITIDGMRITLGYRITDGYDDNAGYGLALVHKFLSSLAKDEDSAKLIKSINRLLQKNSKGDLDSKKVLELAKIANEDYPGTEFQEGVEIIQKAFKPKMSKWFIEASLTNGQGIEKNIPLNITSVDLPLDFDLSFLLPENDKS